VYKDFYQLMLEQFTSPVELFTLSRKQPFSIYAEQETLYIKNTGGNIRRLDRKSVAAFIEHFEETGSQAARDYQDITFNASYLLAVMRYLDGDAMTVERFHSAEDPDSERRYHRWLNAHPDGFVLNLLKSSEGKNNASAEQKTCLHSAQCTYINKTTNSLHPEPFTGSDYFKVCAADLSELKSAALKITTLLEIRKCPCLNNKD